MTGLLFTFLVIAIVALYLFTLRIERFCGHCGCVRNCKKRVEHTTWIWPIYYYPKTSPQPTPTPSGPSKDKPIQPQPSGRGLGDPKPMKPAGQDIAHLGTPPPTGTYPGTPSAVGGPQGAPVLPTKTDYPATAKGELDVSLIVDPTILEQVRKEFLPILNNERACANTSLPTLEYNDSLNSAAQEFAVQIIEDYLRTDYPHFSFKVDEAVDDRIRTAGWTGLVGNGNIAQIIQFSTILFDANTPPYVLRDIMCSNDLKKSLLDVKFNRIGIGYARGNSQTPKPNVKSVYVIVLGSLGTTVGLPVKSTKSVCIDWSVADVCNNEKAPPVINLNL